MKKKLILAAFVAACGVSVAFAQYTKKENSLLTANIEALAGGESGGRTCYGAMRYCSAWDLDYACIPQQTAESCRSYYCRLGGC